MKTQSIWDLQSSTTCILKIWSDHTACNILMNLLSICLSTWWNDDIADMLKYAYYSIENICYFDIEIDERETKPRSTFACKTICATAILLTSVGKSLANLLWRHCPADSLPPLLVPLPRWLPWCWMCTMYIWALAANESAAKLRLSRRWDSTIHCHRQCFILPQLMANIIRKPAYQCLHADKY